MLWFKGFKTSRHIGKLRCLATTVPSMSHEITPRDGLAIKGAGQVDSEATEISKFPTRAAVAFKYLNQIPQTSPRAYTW